MPPPAKIIYSRCPNCGTNVPFPDQSSENGNAQAKVEEIKSAREVQLDRTTVDFANSISTAVRSLTLSSKIPKANKNKTYIAPKCGKEFIVGNLNCFKSVAEIKLPGITESDNDQSKWKSAFTPTDGPQSNVDEDNVNNNSLGLNTKESVPNFLEYLHSNTIASRSDCNGKTQKSMDSALKDILEQKFETCVMPADSNNKNASNKISANVCTEKTAKAILSLSSTNKPNLVHNFLEQLKFIESLVELLSDYRTTLVDDDGCIKNNTVEENVLNRSQSQNDDFPVLNHHPDTDFPVLNHHPDTRGEQIDNIKKIAFHLANQIISDRNSYPQYLVDCALDIVKL